MTETKNADGGRSPAQLIDARIAELGDWRGETLARIRKLIKEADPDVTEDWKWRGVPVWYHAGMLCTGETYQTVVKMTFAKGASLEDTEGTHPRRRSPERLEMSRARSQATSPISSSSSECWT
jgi:hypothetical protein